MIVNSEAQHIWYDAVGSYKSEDSDCLIDISKNGYNIIIKITNCARKGDIYGVVGFNGSKLELSASVGLPGIARFTCSGPIESKTGKFEFDFECEEYGLSLVFLDISNNGFVFNARAFDNEIFRTSMRKHA